MNEEQILNQIAYLLRSIVWSGGSEKVFSPESVRVVGNGIAVLDQARRPLAWIHMGNGESDPTNPGLIRLPVTLRLATAVPGDPYGEGSLLGRNRTATSSKNRGIAEIQREVRRVIGTLYSSLGINISGGEQSASAPEDLATGSDAGIMIAREYAWEVFALAEPFYHQVSKFVMSSGGVGLLSGSWTLPPDRFDRYKIRVFRSAAGGVAPPTVGSGTEIVAPQLVGGDLATSFAVTGLAAGNYAVSVFAAYDDFCEIKPGTYTRSTERNYSAPRSHSAVAVS